MGDNVDNDDGGGSHDGDDVHNANGVGNDEVGEDDIGINIGGGSDGDGDDIDGGG